MIRINKRLNLSQSGFTIVELLTAFALMGVIAMTAIPAYNMFRERAYDAAAKVDMANVFRGIYALQADSSDDTVFLFGRVGPQTLPGPLDNFRLSNNVTAEFIIRIPFFGGQELVLVSMYHASGAFIFREWEIFGNRIKQKIPR